MSAPAGMPAGPREGDHGVWDTLAVGWALSALESPDEARFAVHLPGCERCAGTVRQSLHTVADLAYALPDEAPPPALKVRVMDAVRAEPRRRPDPVASGPEPGRRDENGLAVGSGGPVGGPPAGDDTSAGVVVPFHRPARSGWPRWVAAAAVVALLAALGAWNLQLRADQAELRQVVAQRSAEVAQRDTLVAQRDVAIRQLTRNGPARVAALTADGQPSASRRATVVVRGNQIEIITEGLGASPQNTTYWLWTLRCDTPQPTDLKPIRGFTVPQGRFSVRSIGSDPGFSSATCFAISEELGTATPTAPRAVVAVGQPQ